MITIHHLGVSQSDRVVWLMEELNLPYELKWYDRGADFLAATPYGRIRSTLDSSRTGSWRFHSMLTGISRIGPGPGRRASSFPKR